MIHLINNNNGGDESEMYGTYANMLGLLGTMWLQQQVIFEPTPKSSLSLFMERMGDATTAPHIKRWFLRTLQKKPEVAYTILNVCEQAYLIASGQMHKRAQTRVFAQCNYTLVDTSPYKQIDKMGVQLVVKLNSAAQGGKTFTHYMMWENSVRFSAAKRQTDLKRSHELLEMRDTAKKRAQQPGNDRNRDKLHNDTKTKKELRREQQKLKLDSLSEDNKTGKIICDGYLKCPTLLGPTQPWGGRTTVTALPARGS